MQAIQILEQKAEEMIDQMLEVEHPKTPKEMVALITQYEK